MQQGDPAILHNLQFEVATAQEHTGKCRWMGRPAAVQYKQTFWLIPRLHLQWECYGDIWPNPSAL